MANTTANRKGIVSIVGVVLLGFGVQGLGCSNAVDIPDPNLRARVAAALGKASGAPITKAEMATLIELDAGEASITNLTGLEFATNLTYLYLFSNAISDISALARLANLNRLDLGDNKISDISALSGLTDLTRLMLGQNAITDISTLSGLTQLTGLGLWENTISDISVLARLTKMRRLWLRANAVTDISVLAGLTKLTELDLSENAITDLSFLVENRGVASGDTVRLRDNPLNAPSIQHIQTLQRRGVNVHR